MASSTYQPVNASDGRARDVSSPDTSSPTGTARYTPDLDSDGEDQDSDEVEVLEGQQGYELKELVNSGDGASNGDEGHSVDEEHSDEEAYLDELVSSRHSRRASIQSFELYTPDEERAVRRKLDTHLVLFVALLYLLGFLDRSNIGNAKIAGLTDDLKLNDSQYEWLLTAFYICYILFEWMTVMYQIVPPHIYVSICVGAWGILASLQALATSWGYLVMLRAMLGIGEAAFVGIPIYLSFFFRREELAFRTGLFISAAPLATSFASILAYGIVSLGDKAGIASWRLLFLIEGFPAVLVAVWAWYWVPDSPLTARWLNNRERKIATLRLRKETSTSNTTEKPLRSTVARHKKKFQWHEVVRTLADPKSYLTAAIFFCCNVAFSSMPVFLPTIVNEIGFSKLAAQGLSAPPFLFAFAAVLVTAILSDRYQSRSVPMIFHALMAMGGYLFLAIAGSYEIESHALRYLAVFPICAGFFSAVTIVITWTVNNQDSDEGKGSSMAILNVIGQMGPLLGTRLYPDANGPYYVKGMSVCAVAMAVVAVLAGGLRMVLIRQNAKRRARWQEAEGFIGGPSQGSFIYMI